METLIGKGVFNGIAMGKIQFRNRNEHQVVKSHVENTQAEIIRFQEAKRMQTIELQMLYEKALDNVGEKDARIFEIHKMILEDVDFCGAITKMIELQKVNAEYAIKIISETYMQQLSSIDDSYLKERITDVKDIFRKLIDILSDVCTENIEFDKPVILAADDFSPSETMQMDKSKVLAFVTIHGSTNSHTAILARSMNIPAVISVGEPLNFQCNGKTSIVDGISGKVYIDPDEETIKAFVTKKKKNDEEQALLQNLRSEKSVTLDGKEIKINANIGSPADMEAVLIDNADGVGLYRSKFLYLGRKTYPSEEEQFGAYKLVAESMKGKLVIIRTMDIGADKRADYLELPNEENPAMGYRAIRICLTRQDIFKTQLRALYRASAFGNIAIMFPMIISVEEVKMIKRIVQEVQSELSREGVDYNPQTELGIMIETPAAALISDDLAKEVDFFSIGTNDLTQYTLAIDRQNPKLEHFYNAHHKAVLSLIQMAVEGAHKNGIWVGICGELGADISMTETFLRMGIDELSVSPPYVLKLRKEVRKSKTGHSNH